MTRERARKARQDKRGGFEAATAADSCCCSSNSSPSAPRIRLLASCAGRRRRRRLRPLAAAQPALRPSAAWPLRGLRPLRPLRGQRPLRGHSGRCAASLVPAAAGSSGGDAAHLQQQQQQHLVLCRQLTMHEIENRPCTKLRIQSMKFWSNRLKIETRKSKIETEN